MNPFDDPDGEPSTADHRRMWDMITAYRVSQIVSVAARYSWADHLDGGCDTAEGIAAAEGTTADAMGRLLRAGVPLGLTMVDGKRTRRPRCCVPSALTVRSRCGAWPSR